LENQRRHTVQYVEKFRQARWPQASGRFVEFIEFVEFVEFVGFVEAIETGDG
jgi:hypothetical protein